MSKPALKHPLQTFITGALALLPLAATVLIIGWLVSFIGNYIGPNSAFGELLTRIGLGVTEREWVGYLLGIVAVLVFIYLFGALTEAGLQRGISRVINSIMLRIPVVRTVYDIIQKFVGMMSQRDEDELKSMSAVWIYFGGPDKPTTVVLGLLSTSEPVPVRGQMLMAVIVPTAPVPVGGGLLYVPPEWIVPAEIGVEGVTSIYVSMGVTSAQYLK
jgi:uncharacterized membrane protein